MFYNPDCYSCLELDLIKYIYQASSNVDILGSDVYLPQMPHVKLYKTGEFDNDVHEDLTKSDNWFWHLRFAKNINENFCDISQLSYNLALA